MVIPKNHVRAELYISGNQAKLFFALLRQHKEPIELELGYPLEWDELPTKQDCRIVSYLKGVEPENEGDWACQHEWLAKILNDMHRVFAQRVRTLEADGQASPIE